MTNTTKWQQELDRKLGKENAEGATLIDNGTGFDGPRVWRLKDGRVVACYTDEETAVVVD